MNDFFTSFASGTISHTNNETDASGLAWNPHPTFKGVAIKHLITQSDTNGRFSAHLVRLDPNSEIGDHVHENNWELHEVAGGFGHCVLDGKTIPYQKGVAAVLPENIPHTVKAGAEGLLLLAKFVPALL